MTQTTSQQAREAEAHERPVRIGVFSTVADADQAVGNLLAAGFTSKEISVLCSDKAVERHFREFEHEEPAGTFTPAAAAAGGAIGATLGGLAAIAGVVTTGGAAVLAAGAVAALSGGVVGGLIGAMMTRGVEKELANFYDQALTAGKILVGVEPTGDRIAERLAAAERVLAESGADPQPLPEG
jgi:hypothetical protein